MANWIPKLPKIGSQYDASTPTWRAVKPVDLVMAKSHQYWLIASVVVLLGSLTVFVANVVAGFAYFNSKVSPLWVTVVGVASVLGIATGFAGLFFVLILAAMRARKNDKARAVSAE